MANYTNTGLVNHAKTVLKMNTMYMWGGILRKITEQYITQVSSIKGYESQYPSSRKTELRKVVGKNYYGVDCVGLIKSYYWSGKINGGTGSPNYGKSGYPDVNAHGMYNAAKVKGPISTMPEVPGLVVYCKSRPHVGVYIGNGKVIESTLSSKGDGVIQTNLKDWIWEYWMECPYITYEKAEKETPDTVEKQAVLAYTAKVRAYPKPTSAILGTLTPGTKVTVVEGSETDCKGSDGKIYTYVKIKRSTSFAWIVKSAIKE